MSKERARGSEPGIAVGDVWDLRKIAAEAQRAATRQLLQEVQALRDRIDRLERDVAEVGGRSAS